MEGRRSPLPLGRVDPGRYPRCSWDNAASRPCAPVLCAHRGVSSAGNAPLRKVGQIRRFSASFFLLLLLVCCFFFALSQNGFRQRRRGFAVRGGSGQSGARPRGTGAPAAVGRAGQSSCRTGRSSGRSSPFRLGEAPPLSRLFSVTAESELSFIPAGKPGGERGGGETPGSEAEGRQEASPRSGRTGTGSPLSFPSDGAGPGAHVGFQGGAAPRVPPRREGGRRQSPSAAQQSSE